MATYVLTARRGTEKVTQTYSADNPARSHATYLRAKGWKVRVKKRED